MNIHVDTSSSLPVFQQIVDEVKSAIARGACAPGEMIPSVRALAAQSLVNPNTVAKAYRDLELQGIVTARRGIGLVVSDEAPSICRNARRESLQVKFDALLAEAQRAGLTNAEIRAAFNAAIRKPSASGNSPEKAQ